MQIQGYKRNGPFFLTCTTCGATGIKKDAKSRSAHGHTKLHKDALAALTTERACDVQDDVDLNDWKYEVMNGDTVLGFQSWIEHKIQATRQLLCDLCPSNEIETVLKATPTPSGSDLPPVICGECNATADSVLELAKHWKTSGHKTARVHLNSGPKRRKTDQPGTASTYFAKADQCIKLCEALAAFWGDGVCDAPIQPGAYLTEEDTPIRDLVRAAVGWRKP